MSGVLCCLNSSSDTTGHDSVGGYGVLIIIWKHLDSLMVTLGLLSEIYIRC